MRIPTRKGHWSRLANASLAVLVPSKDPLLHCIINKRLFGHIERERKTSSITRIKKKESKNPLFGLETWRKQSAALHEIIANARIWRTSPTYATPTHVANVTVEKKTRVIFYWPTTDPFFSTITFARKGSVAGWRSSSAGLRKPNYEKFRRLQLSQ